MSVLTSLKTQATRNFFLTVEDNQVLIFWMFGLKHHKIESLNCSYRSNRNNSAPYWPLTANAGTTADQSMSESVLHLNIKTIKSEKIKQKQDRLGEDKATTSPKKLNSDEGDLMCFSPGVCRFMSGPLRAANASQQVRPRVCSKGVFNKFI